MEGLLRHFSKDELISKIGFRSGTKKFNKMEYNEIIDFLLKNSDKIHTIHFPDNFNYKLFPGDLPQKCKCVKFGSKFNHLLQKNTFPDETETIIFGCNFNHSIEGVLPNNLKKIHFDYHFNQSLFSKNGRSLLPSSIREISIFGYFSQPLEGVINEGCERVSLKLFNYFHNFKGDFFPSSVISLILEITSHDDNIVYDLILPHKLEELHFTLKNTFNLREDFNIPLSVTKFKILDEILERGEVKNWKKIFYFGFGVCYGKYTKYDLVFRNNFNSPVDPEIIKGYSFLKIKRVLFGQKFNQDISFLKCIDGIENIILRDFNREIDGRNLPKSLKSVIIKNHEYRKMIKNFSGVTFGLSHFSSPLFLNNKECSIIILSHQEYRSKEKLEMWIVKKNISVMYRFINRRKKYSSFVMRGIILPKIRK